MIILYCLLAVAAFFIVFLLAPIPVVCLTVFSKKRGVSLLDRDLEATYYAPYAARIRADFAWFQARECRRVAISAFDGAELLADYYPAGKGKLAICVHGYRSTPLNGFSSLGRFLAEELGYDLLFIHQRGHGVSGGKRSTMGVLEQEDVLSWSRWACALPDVDTIIFAGLSMGCASVAYASDRFEDPRIKAMILDCGFTSPENQMAKDCRQRHLPVKVMLPMVCFFAKHFLHLDIRRSTCESLARTRVPALFMHGTEDEAVPISETQKSFESCVSPKALYIAEKAQHGCTFLAGGAEAEAAIRTFLIPNTELEAAHE